MRSPWLDGRELAAVALTFSGNAVVHRVLPYAGHIPANLLTAGGVTGLALLAGASLDELGLSPAFARDGLRLGRDRRWCRRARRGGRRDPPFHP